ncbi:MAG: ADP-dependent glucokinase/phosphofructokinase [Alphaproteobacteria bacterium]|nr:ADP-dependent glucokinase/phosphofructokinase [Alphaproteobacteria bacterium]
MNFADLKKTWLQNYASVPQSLEKVKEIKTAATAFNANIDAVIKISGKKLAELIKLQEISLDELIHIKRNALEEPSDVVKGIFKCFKSGIAEEWLTEDIEIYNWMVKNIHYDRLQMGGQGGIVANVLSVTGVQKVYVHTNSIPKLQAEQFLKEDNLYSFDETGAEKPAHQIDRKDDVPLIHWIIEFDKGDEVEIEEQKFVCPKSNRFIATYDPLNLNLVKDTFFVEDLSKHAKEFIVLSGFHALTEKSNGLSLLKEALPIVETWKKTSSNGVLHLEIASTQDKKVRKEIVEKFARISDSVGVNERETIDVLEVIEEETLAKTCESDTHAVNLFKGLLKIKKYIGCPRIQLHMFGLYITLQDKNFKISPLANLRGMALAATVAAGKAGTGSINEKKNLLWAHGKEVSDVGLNELTDLAKFIGDENLLSTGISSYDGFDVIAIPTILVEKPITLVGMGDTISSTSLIGTR